MNEAKTLVHMSVSAMFATMILSGVLILTALGYQMWAYFSRQDAANQKMKDYVNYVAYDDTTVRGQEVISLYQYAEQEGLFVALYSETSQSGDTTMDGVVVNSGVHFYVPNTCPWESIATSCGNIPTEHANANVKNALELLKSDIAANSTRDSNRCKCCIGSLPMINGKLNYNLLVQAFTNSYSTWTHLGYPGETGIYAAYKSVLVYDDDTSTDVIGIMLIRQTATTTF